MKWRQQPTADYNTAVININNGAVEYDLNVSCKSWKVMCNWWGFIRNDTVNKIVIGHIFVTRQT